MGPALRTLLFFAAVPGAVAAGIPLLLVQGEPRLAPRGACIAGLALIALGAACGILCAVDFVVTGRGTPSPLDPPKRLIASRLYRFTRNPMYLAVLLTLFGETVALCSATLLVYAAMLALLFHLFVVLYEEPALRARFGSSYDGYRAAVPRWLPRPRRATR
jgi:protein-S-isoprenylcysteine O-methyltransferase Ste14